MFDVKIPSRELKARETLLKAACLELTGNHKFHMDGSGSRIYLPEWPRLEVFWDHNKVPLVSCKSIDRWFWDHFPYKGSAGSYSISSPKIFDEMLEDTKAEDRVYRTLRNALYASWIETGPYVYAGRQINDLLYEAGFDHVRIKGRWSPSCLMIGIEDRDWKDMVLFVNVGSDPEIYVETEIFMNSYTGHGPKLRSYVRDVVALERLRTLIVDHFGGKSA